MTNPSASERFALSYQVSEEQFCRAHRVHLRRAFSNVKTLVVLTFALGLAALQAQVLGPDAGVNRFFMVLWVGLAVFVMYAFIWLPRRLYRSSERFAAPQRLELDEQKLRFGPEGAVREHEWAEVQSLSHAGDSFLLYVDGGLPIVVPKSAFSDGEAAARFEALIRQRRQPSSR